MERILIIENDINLIKEYDEFFKNDKNIEIVGKTYNGKEAIDFIESKKEFDVIILDLVLPVIDGFEILEYLKKHNINKRVIITSSFKSNEVIKKTYNYDVDYFILKPFNFDSIKEKIDGFNNFSKYNTMIKLKNKLHDLGMPSSIRGYYYVSEALKWMEVAKTGTAEQRKKWNKQGFNLYAHNYGSADIYVDENRKYDEVVRVLIKTHGLIGQYIRGEVKFGTNKDLYNLIERNFITKAKLKKVLKIYNECLIRGTSETVYNNMESDIPIIIWE